MGPKKADVGWGHPSAGFTANERSLGEYLSANEGPSHFFLLTHKKDTLIPESTED